MSRSKKFLKTQHFTTVIPNVYQLKEAQEFIVLVFLFFVVSQQHFVDHDLRQEKLKYVVFLLNICPLYYANLLLNLSNHAQCHLHL